MMPMTPIGIAHLADLEAVRPSPGGDRLADGIGQLGDLVETDGHRFDPLRVERQTVA